MRHLMALSALFIFLSAGVAYAEEATVTDESIATGTQQGRSGCILNMSLALQLDSTMGGDTHWNYYDVAMSNRLRAQMFDRLTVDLSLGLIHVDIELFEPYGAPFDAVLEMPWRATIGGGARMLLYRWRFLDISLFAEIYFPLGDNAAQLHSAEFRDELALLNLMNIEDVREWITVRHHWYRAEFGVTVRGLIGRWRPFIDVKYVHLSGRLELDLHEDMESFVDLIAPDVSRTYDASFMYPYYALGFEVELGYGVELEVRVAASPTLNDGWAFVGRAVIEVPLTPQPRRNWTPYVRRRDRGG